MARSNKSFLAAAMLASLLLLPIACDRKTQPRQSRTEPAVAVTLRPVRLQPVQRTVEVVGSLFGEEDATLSAKVPGRVIRILRDVGDRAACDQPLAQVDPADYELARNQKQAALEETLARLGLTEIPAPDFDVNVLPTVQRTKLTAANAESRFQRAKELHRQKPPLISEQEFADQQTAFQVARTDYDVALLAARATIAQARTAASDLNLAIQRLADTTIRTPGGPAASASRFAVAARFVSVGEYVKEGTALFRVVADDPVKFRAAVPERYVAEIKTGQQAAITIDANADAFAGTISRISPQIDPANRTFQVEVLVANPKGLLKPGAFARGAILTRTDSQVPFVPAESVVSFAGVKKVFTVKDNKAVEYIVETGVRHGDCVEVTKPLPNVAAVVVAGASKLASDTPVTLKTDPATQPR